MKRLLSFTGMAFILIITTSQVKAPATPKVRMLTVSMTADMWNNVFAIFEKSSAPYTFVKSISDSLLIQLSDTIKNPSK